MSGSGKKQYGLIFTGKSNLKHRPAASHASFLDEDEVRRPDDPHLKMKQTTKRQIEAALDVDPTIFQYDEVYEEISEPAKPKIAQTKPKYISKLLHVASERKLERELLHERKAQKELEQEKDKYADKEKFVTSSYKEKLNEFKELLSRREAEESYEKVMDVTKQSGLGGFYRYLLDEGLDSKKCQKQSCTEYPESNTRTTNRTSSPRRAVDDSNASGKYNQGKETELNGKSGRLPEKVRLNSSEGNAEQDSSNAEPNLSSTYPMQIPYPKQNSESTICEDTRQLPLACEKIGSANPASEPGRPASPGPPEGMIRSKPRITTQEELEAAKERYLLRKEAGIHPTIQDSDE